MFAHTKAMKVNCAPEGKKKPAKTAESLKESHRTAWLFFPFLTFCNKRKFKLFVLFSFLFLRRAAILSFFRIFIIYLSVYQPINLLLYLLTYCIYLSICQFMSLSICLPLSLSIHLSIIFFIYSSFYLFVYLSVFSCTHLSAYYSLSPSIYQLFYPSIYLSIYPSISLFTYSLYLWIHLLIHPCYFRILKERREKKKNQNKRYKRWQKDRKQSESNRRVFFSLFPQKKKWVPWCAMNTSLHG